VVCEQWVDIAPFIARAGAFAALQNANRFVQQMRILPNGIGLTWPDELELPVDDL
jgi:hypothetical protein